MNLTTLSETSSHGGIQGVYSHPSSSTNTNMTFAVFVPPHKKGEKLPVVWYLSGITCTHANVMDKGEYRKACAELGLIFVAADTSPRRPDLNGKEVTDAENGDWTFGLGAGFYVDATEPPFASHYKMRTYFEDELPALIGANFPADLTRQSIMGHSMGGHGALTIGLRNADRFKSISAFAPISSLTNCSWGENALTRYIGSDRTNWQKYDACALIEDGARHPNIRVDQGSDDDFLDDYLKINLLKEACKSADQPLILGMHEGYGHSYLFVSTFMADHLEWHAQYLNQYLK